MDRVVGGRIAGVQRDHHVDGTGCKCAHVTGFEVQALQRQLLRGGIAQVHHVFTQLDAADRRIAGQRTAQMVVDRECQVALARAEVEHPHRGRLLHQL